MLIERIEHSLQKLKIGLNAKNVQAQKEDIDSLYDKYLKQDKEVQKYMSNTVITKQALNTQLEEKEKVINSLNRFLQDTLDGKKDLAIQDLQNISNAINNGNKELSNAWGTYRSDKYSAMAKLITALVTVLDDPRLDELGQLKKSIETSTIGTMATLDEINKFNALSNEIITSRGMDPNIQEFVLKLANGDPVYLYELTNEVLDWLRENRLDKKVQIIINA